MFTSHLFDDCLQNTPGRPTRPALFPLPLAAAKVAQPSVLTKRKEPEGGRNLLEDLLDGELSELVAKDGVIANDLASQHMLSAHVVARRERENGVVFCLTNTRSKKNRKQPVQLQLCLL